MRIKTKSYAIPFFTIAAFAAMVGASIWFIDQLIVKTESLQLEANSGVENIFTEQLQRLSELNARQMRDPVYNLDVDTISTSLIDIVQDKGVLFATVVEADGKGLGQLHSKEYGLDQQDPEASKSAEFQPFKGVAWDKVSKKASSTLAHDDADKVLVVSPIVLEEEHIGFLGICFSTERLKQTFATAQTDIESLQESAKNDLRNMYIVIAIVVLILALIIYGVLKNSILAPLNKVRQVAENIASGNGDLTIRMGLTRNDEIGDLAKGIDSMLENLSSMVRELKAVTEEVSVAGKSSRDTSLVLADEGEKMSARMRELTSCVKGSGEQIQTVATQATGLNEASDMISGATNELNQSISELSQNAGKASHISEEASDKAQVITDKMQTLLKSSNEIEEVVDVIAEITAQTKLLALNATIEAASAGEAGKGFSVVAQEVKALSSRTEEAALSIGEKLKVIQDLCQRVDDEVGQQNGIIENITEISSSIASAVEEQSVTVSMVSERVGKLAGASTVLADSSQQMLDANQNVIEITEHMDNAVSVVNENSASGKTMSSKLEKLAGDLSDQVKHFSV